MHVPLLRKSKILRKNQTDAELILWERLRAHRFHGMHFRRQHPIGNRFILDFYCSAAKIAIEIDGEIHNRPDNQANDALRTEILAQRNIRVIRFRNSEGLKLPRKIGTVENKTRVDLHQIGAHVDAAARLCG